MCRNIFHPKPCNCENNICTQNMTAKEKFILGHNTQGSILDAEYAWQRYLERKRRNEIKNQRW